MILAFAGSNSSTSINHQLITYVSTLIEEVEVLKLTDYPLPIYSMDIERETGLPVNVKLLYDKLNQYQTFIVSLAEHNGGVTSFFKNSLDWLSRHEGKFLQGKSFVLLSTSPGGRGALSALEMGVNLVTRFKGEVLAKLNIGNFYEVFQEGKISDPKVLTALKATLVKLPT